MIPTINRYNTLLDYNVHQSHKQWYQIARMTMVVALTTFAALALFYKVDFFIPPLLKTAALLLVIGGARQLWEYYSLFIEKHHKWAEIGKIYNSLPETTPNRMLQARFNYHNNLFTAWKEKVSELEAKSLTTELITEIAAAKQEAAIQKILTTWLTVLLVNPYTLGELSHYCTYVRLERDDFIRQIAYITKNIPHAEVFVRFKDGSTLSVDQVLAQDFSNKLTTSS